MTELKAMRYKPYFDDGAVKLLVGKPAKIVDRLLRGTEISVFDKNTFLLWTDRKKKAKTLAAKVGLRCKLMDGEAEMLVPRSMWEVVLPAFGAKRKRVLPPERLAAAREHMRRVRELIKRPNSASGH